MAQCCKRCAHVQDEVAAVEGERRVGGPKEALAGRGGGAKYARQAGLQPVEAHEGAQQGPCGALQEPVTEVDGTLLPPGTACVCMRAARRVGRAASKLRLEACWRLACLW